MDSQLTLVPAVQTHYLAFSTDSMKNATLSLDSVPLYTVFTDPQNAHTDLRTIGTAQLLARITRKALLPDTITFPGGKEIPLAKWLRKTRLPDGLSIRVLETEHGSAILKVHSTHRLALFKEGDLETPIAHWERRNARAPPTLVLPAGATQPHIIIAAFIVREFELRMREQAARVAVGAPPFVPGALERPWRNESRGGYLRAWGR
ncbi:hypothetical protein DFH09DRAFT_1175412 [Mycena vulgaris]|nr:hypothetical protein DFH09DRAFT_1175412 [Mycena vulgaris]